MLSDEFFRNNSFQQHNSKITFIVSPEASALFHGCKIIHIRMVCLHYTPIQDLKIQLGRYYLAAIEMKSIQKKVGKWEILYAKQISFLQLVDMSWQWPYLFLFFICLLNNKHLGK